ncbi:MAG: serine/threonine protein kinase [Polyangiaceae bacterium]|jgi:eukaryotic-like serine/threonine-protein kinase
MHVTVGQLIDSKYRIVRMLGEGGMGAVYEGQNVRIGHRVAIKVLHAEIATRKDVLERFEREAQAAGKIGSDHIVEVYDLGELPDGARYMVMEYLDGENLSSRVQSTGRMPASAIAPVLMQLLEGLGAAHAAGIIHRDLKPDNIFLVRDKKTGGDFVKIVDFGVSKFNQSSPDSVMSMTRTGAVIGTPYYMSPEQAKGSKHTDHRSDLYSVGVVLFECATGQVPFQADTFNELMFKIVLEPPPDPETLVQGLDPRFAAIIRKAMAREPDARYQNAAEFQQAISAWMSAAGVGSGVFAQAPPPRAPMTSGGDLGTTPATSGPSPVALGKTAGSLPGAVATAPPTGTKKSKGPLVAGVGVALAIMAVVGALAFKGRQGKATATAEPPAAVEAVQTATAAATATAPPAAAPSAAPTAAPAPTAVAADVHDAGVTAELSSHSHGGTTSTKQAGPKPGAAPAAAPTGTAAQVKGRTIRTDL